MTVIGGVVRRSLRVLIAASIAAAYLVAGPSVRDAHGATFTYTVNVTTDSNSAGSQTACATAAAGCTFRAALTLANTKPDLDVINIGFTGTQSITMSGAENENSNAGGDYDVTGSFAHVINITGNGVDVTTFNGNDVDRILHVFNSNATVNIKNLSMQNATVNYGILDFEDDGGAIFNGTNDGAAPNAIGEGGGNIILTGVEVSGNHADGSGGGIYNGSGGSGGTIYIDKSTIEANQADGTLLEGDGGGIYNEGGNITIINSTIANNIAGLDGGGIYSFTTGANTDLTNVTMTDNQGLDAGASQGSNVHVLLGAFTVRNSIIVDPVGGDLANCFGTIFGSPLLGGGYNLDDDNSCNFNTTGDQSGVALNLAIAANGGVAPNAAIRTAAIGAGTFPWDAANAAFCPATDERGEVRHGVRCDLGAFESPAVPDLIVTKNANKTTVATGNTLAYTITITNGSDGNANTVTVTDDLPATLTWVSSVPSQGTCGAGDPVSCSLGTILPGNSATVTINVTVADGTNSIPNTASATTVSEPASMLVNNSDTHTVNAADLHVEKTANKVSVVALGTIKYTITVKNEGYAPATVSVLTDDLSTELDYTAHTVSQGTCTPIAATDILNCAFGTIAVGVTVTITIDANVLSASGAIRNTAVAGMTPATAENDTGDNTATYTVNGLTPATGADLHVTKTASISPVDTTNIGQDEIYTVNIVNEGLSSATGVALVDVLPVGINPLGITVSDPPGAATCTNIFQLVTCDLGTMAANAEINVIITAEIASASAPLSNSALATSDNEEALYLFDNLGFVHVPGTNGSVDIAISKVGDKIVADFADELNYTLTITNRGNIDAEEVTVTDILPFGLILDSMTIIQGDGTCTEQIGILTCLLGTLSAGETHVINIKTYIYEVANPLFNSAMVFTTTPEEILALTNNFDFWEVRANSPDLTISKSANPKVVAENDPVEFTIKVGNNGGKSANNVTVLDTMPDEISIGTVSIENPGPNDCNFVLQQITCTIPTIIVNDEITITITGTMAASGITGNRITNTVTVSTTDAELDTEDNDASASLNPPDLVVHKTVDDSVVDFHDPINYTVTVENLGYSTAEDVIMIDIFPIGVALDAVSTDTGTCTDLWIAATCSLGNIGIGETATISLAGTVGAVHGGFWNIAMAFTDTPGDNLINNFETAGAVSIADLADLAVTKTASGTVFNRDDVFTYTVTAKNNGAGQASETTIYDLVPLELHVNSVTPSQGTCTTIIIFINCKIGIIPAGGTATFTIEVKVLNGNGVKTNFAFGLSERESIFTLLDNFGTVDVTLKGPDLEILKTASASEVVRGDPLNYTVTIRNNGMAAGGITVFPVIDELLGMDLLTPIIDVLPGGFTLNKGAITTDTGVGCVNLFGAAILCDIGVIEPGAEVNFTLNGVVDQDAEVGFEAMTNAAFGLTFGEGFLDLFDNFAIVKTTILIQPQGYWLCASDGGIFSYGRASFYGSTGAIKLNKPIVGMTPTPSGYGYWFVASDGGIFAYGDAAFYGSMGGSFLAKPIVGMASTPSGNGYWLVASDGGIFSFGDASFYGSTGAMTLNKPIVGMTRTPSGHGYWFVASDGGIFSFGDASFYGSTGAMTLNKPIVGMASTPSGTGYWLVASDGGIFAFGDAPFFGSTGAIKLNKPIVGMSATMSGNGYRFVASDGGIFAYGDAIFYGSMGGQFLAKPIVGMATVPT